MTKVAENEKFHIEILVILKEAQQQHGLRHKDYESYHQYISRKLHRMRKSLNFQQGKGNRWTPKKMTRAGLHDGRLLVVKLFEAERAWASAMRLKAQSAQGADQRKMHHMRQRLKRATALARELWALCRWEKCIEDHGKEECGECARTDAHTVVEAHAYCLQMRAALAFELSDWAKANSLFGKAHHEYAELAKAVDKDHEATYLAKTEELGPLMRYCAANTQQNADESQSALSAVCGADLDQFGDLIQHIYRNQAAVVTEVHWLGMVIPVKQETVKLAVLALKDTNEELSKQKLDLAARIKMYDSLLKTVTDALAVVRDDLKGSGLTNPTQITNQCLENMTRMQLLLVYLQYVKLAKTAERNLLLIETNQDAVKPQNVARLYDTLIQNLQEMSGLPGLSPSSSGTGSGTGSTGSSLTLQQGLVEAGQLELQAKIRLYTAHRCHRLSQAHLLMKRFVECSALLTRTLRHCDDASESLQLLSRTQTDSDIVGDDSGSGVCLQHRMIPGPWPEQLLAEALPALVDTVHADQLICRANKCLELASPDEAALTPQALPVTTDKPLMSRLDEFIPVDPVVLHRRLAGQSLLRLPPSMEALPVKPVFYDLAQHHVRMPSLDDKTMQGSAASGKAGGGKAGITGFVKGWLWGSSNSGQTHNKD